MRQLVEKWLVVFAAISLFVSAAAGGTGGRPTLSVSAPALGCPAINGAFVVVLDPAGRMLLLSGSEFLGGRRVGEATGEALRVALPRSSWELAGAGSPASPVEVWAAAYKAHTGGIGGCVAFDREQFSSEGDLVTYAQWLVNEVYLRLPKDERDRFPALRLDDRVVRLRVQPAGYQPVQLHETEGATMALKVPGGPQTLLLRPFVLDETTQRLAIELSITDKPYWQAAEKRSLGFVVVSPTEPATLADIGMTIQVEPAAAPPAASNPPS
jgi:hypothetical protein